MTLNEKIKLCRLMSMMTVAEVADDSGYSRSALYKIEEGRRKVPLSYFMYWHRKGLIEVHDIGKFENICEGGKTK